MAQGVYKARYAKADTALIEELRERCDGEMRKGALFGKHGAADFRLRFQPQQQRYILSVVVPVAGRFRVTRRGALDRWMAAFVPALEFRSRDSRFDRDFNVQTRDPELTSGILTKQPNRATVRHLFERGVQSVHLDGDRIKATGMRKALGTAPAADDILELIERLASLAAAVTTFVAHHEVRPAPKNDPAVVASWSVLVLLGVLGFAMLIAGAIEYTLVQPAQILLACALLGLPAVAPVVFVLALVVQRRTSPYGLVRGLAGVALVVVPLFVSGSLLFSNGVLDETAADEHVVTVVGKSARKKDKKMRYHAGLASWWADDDVRWVRISKATYDELEPDASLMEVRTHPGLLGYEWIEGYSVR
jgi:hypothetical protein